jgi:NADPH:quinone reductase-like Zn-dependent oxidoreductase
VRVFSVLGGVGAGQTLLINGAAGGVGAVAVQMAVARGARVVGTASERNHDFLRSLGAEPTTYGPGLVERVSALAPDVPVEQIFTFAQAAGAHRVSQDGHVRGKLILIPG